jgi:hypothetical protein
MDPMKALEPYGMDSGAVTSVVVSVDEARMRAGQPGGAFAAYAGTFGTEKLAAAIKEEGFTGRRGEDGFAVFTHASPQAGVIALRPGLAMIGDATSIDTARRLLRGEGTSVVTPDVSLVLDAVGDCGLISIGVGGPFSRGIPTASGLRTICVGVKVDGAGAVATIRFAGLAPDTAQAQAALEAMESALAKEPGLKSMKSEVRGRLAFLEVVGPIDPRVLGR